MTLSSSPPVVEHLGPLLDGYDVLLCDIWGVVHDGQRAFPAANEALTRFRERGGTVILVSNAPSPSDALVDILDEKAVWRSVYDGIVSSGDLALQHIREKGYSRVHHIGRQGRDGAFFRALGAPSTPIEEADAIACTGLVHERREQAESYRPLLERALPRKVPFVCANPDLHVHVGEDLLPCAGAIAAIYEEMGGPVFWAGKPHPVAYDSALRRAGELRGAPVPKNRVLAIGDSVRTDLAAAKNAGVDALFVASGIHRDELISDGVIGLEALARLFSENGTRAVAATAALRW